MQSIRSDEPATRIANGSAFVKGVVNLRVTLDCDSAEYNDCTVDIVLNLRGRVIGALLDCLSASVHSPEAPPAGASSFSGVVDPARPVNLRSCFS